MSDKEYATILRQRIKECLDIITDLTDLKMLYGMARGAYKDAVAQKGGAV